MGMARNEYVLTKEQVRKAYGMWCEGYTQDEIADAFYVSRWTITRAFKRYGLACKFKKRPVRNLTTGKTFPTIADAARAYGLSHSHVGRACRGERKTAGGMVWAYVEED